MPPTLEWWRLALLAVLFLGLGAAWWWARNRAQGGGGPFLAGRGRAAGRAPRLRVVERRWLDGRTSVALVEADGRTWLLAASTGGGVAWQAVGPAGAESPEGAPRGRAPEAARS